MKYTIGQKVILRTEKSRFPHWQRMNGTVATIRSLGVIPTVTVQANTNAGYVWYGTDYNELEPAPEDAELTILWSES